MKSRFTIPGAFTLVELVIAITISSIVFLGVMNLVGDTLSELSTSNRSSELIVSLSDVINQFEGLSSSYDNKELFVDSAENIGTDIILLSNSGSTGGAIIGLVNPDTNTIFTGATLYPLYNKKHIGYSILNTTQLSEINGNTDRVYDINFYNDKIFTDVHLRDFQVTLFNTGSITDINMSLLLKYGEVSEGIAWEDLGVNNLYDINLNF